MDASLRIFVSQFVGAVAATLVPVLAVTFLSIPHSVGGHPGESRSVELVVGSHMT
ncbi:MAG: hypothetical protein ABI790_17475 [Betaproteobacteria bacterium]